MNIIFCQSYLSIPRTITLAEKSDEFLIMTTNQNTYKFLSLLYPETQIVCFADITINFKDVLSYRQIIVEKRKVKQYIHKFSGNNVYFFLVAFCEYQAWIIKQLSKKNTIYYQAATQLPHNLRITNSMKSIILQKLYKLLWGVDVEKKILDKKLFFPLSDKFFNKIRVNKVVIDPNNKITDRIVFEKIKIYGDILYLSGGTLEYGFVHEAEYKNKVNQLVGLLINYKTFIKLHPYYTLKRNDEINLQEIENYFPANLLITCFEIVIGYETSTLYEAANNGKVSISLLNYYKPISEQKKEIYIEYLKQNLERDKKIHFPKSIDEIKELLLLPAGIN